MEKKWSNKKIKRVGKEIINAIELYLSMITSGQAKTVIKYDPFCNPFYRRKTNKYYCPNKKTKKIYTDLSFTIFKKIKLLF